MNGGRATRFFASLAAALALGLLALFARACGEWLPETRDAETFMREEVLGEPGLVLSNFSGRFLTGRGSRGSPVIVAGSFRIGAEARSRVIQRFALSCDSVVGPGSLVRHPGDAYGPLAAFNSVTTNAAARALGWPVYRNRAPGGGLNERSPAGVEVELWFGPKGETWLYYLRD